MTGATFDERALAARDWASANLGIAGAAFAPASADASFRRYFRLEEAGKSWIIMDAPPELEDCAPFANVAELLARAGVHVPRVLAWDRARGFMLLSDLGRQTYLDVLNEANADALFDPAIEALVRWQAASRPGVLPPYDRALLARELALFPDWYLARHLNLQLNAEDRAILDRVFEQLIAQALAQPKVFVHRDYMPRNLMLSEPNPGVLDFQDAVYGPIAYDPICLFKDAFLSWPESRVEAWLRRYYDAASAVHLPMQDWAAFRRDCDWIGLQRHLKVLGVFARINYRDGKPKYLADTPRFLRYLLDAARKYAELEPLASLVERLVLPKVALPA